MAKRSRPEFDYNEKTGLYRKRIKNPNTGKWVPVYGHTKEETRRKVDEKKAELARQLELAEDPPFYEYAAAWFALHTGSYSEKRRQDYRNAINNHICPVLKDKQLREITYSDVRAVMASVAGMSKSGQQKVVTTLRRIFEAAEKDRIITESPCRDLKPAGRDAPEKVALTRAQQDALLAAIHDCSIYPFVMLCLYAGLRREEALGLKWADVHLDGKAPHLDVRTACTWEGKNAAKESELLKSSAAYRTIPLPPQLVDLLKTEQGSAAGDYVISNDGKLLTAAAFRRRWDAVQLREEHTVVRKMRGKEIQQELHVGDPVPYHKGVAVSLGFHTTPHLLRHTYISELVLAGVSVKRVQYLAGHSSPILTLKVYTHLMENRPEDLMGDVLKAFGK